MKKFLFLAIAAAAMTSCSQDETLEVAQKQAISFGEAFVGNSTRAAVDKTYSSTNLIETFKVYGTVTGTTGAAGTATIFAGDDVKRPENLTEYNASTAWLCDNIQYWIPAATYKFMAIADASSVSSAEGLPTTISYKDATTAADAVQKDLLLSELETNGIRTVTTDASANPTENPVKFTFSHLLSKAKFTFSNTSNANDNYTFDVKNIRFIDVKKEGTYTISSKAWEATGSSSDLLFGNLESKITTTEQTKESANERVFVPVNYTKENPLTAKFTVETLINGTVVTSKNYTATIVCNFEAGKAYNFNVALSNTKIDFTVVAVNPWGTTINVPATDNSATITVVADEETSTGNTGGVAQ